jgi:ubiquinone/menaquinone biosynthesis C-methylase UbiE
VTLYHDHVFPRLQALVTAGFEDRRRELFAHARGRVLELGVGTGAGLDAYPAAVSEVIGIDPAEAMVHHAVDRLRQLGRPAEGAEGLPYRVAIHRADAQALPYDDHSFDTVVAFLTLCTIPDPLQAAREARRVLRPRGRLLVLEHVRADHPGHLARWQDRLDPLWTRLAGGCHLNRDTTAVLDAAGFDTRQLRRYRDQRLFPPASPRIQGVVETEA